MISKNSREAIYKITCRWGHYYVGQTERDIGIRMEEQ